LAKAEEIKQPEFLMTEITTDEINEEKPLEPLVESIEVPREEVTAKIEEDEQLIIPDTTITDEILDIPAEE
jgi:hypothetical protein